eukprot:60101-Prorocentrum_lima.AAC.1
MDERCIAMGNQHVGRHIPMRASADRTDARDSQDLHGSTIGSKWRAIHHWWRCCLKWIHA